MEIQYSKQAIRFLRWSSIPVEEPDNIDLEMLEEIKKDADCKEFVSSDETMKILGL